MLNIAGVTYALITIGLISTIIFTNHKIRFVTNTYWFWMAIGAFCFLWVLSVRFIPDWITYWTKHSTIYENLHNPVLKEQRYWNERLSRAFMLDACPAFFSMLTISLVADPSRRVARIVAPIALIGGITALGTILTDGNIPEENARFTAEYLFFGIGKEQCFFFMHWCQVMIAIGVLVNTPTSGWRVWISSVGSFLVYLCYVGIVMAASGVCWFCTGLAQNDYMSRDLVEGGGQYHIVADFTHFTGKIWWLNPIILLGILVLMGLGVGGVAHDYIFTSKWIWQYGNAKGDVWWKPYNYEKFTKLNQAWW